ncbi:MAG: hypothetical protein PHI34_08395 [Acidobacteriota bacterium]|nr:hypothetical protein [Acidobacteriota bacterium]
MTHARRVSLSILLVVLAVFALSLPSSAQVKFRGRYLTGVMTEPVVTVNIEILSYSTVEEIAELAKAYNERGEAGFHAAFRSMKKGSLQVTSGRGLRIEFHAAHEYKTEKGLKIELIAENERLELGSMQRPSSGVEVMVCILEINDKGRGEARIYEDASFKILPSGEMAMNEHKRAPKIIAGLTQMVNKKAKD